MKNLSLSLRTVFSALLVGLTLAAIAPASEGGNTETRDLLSDHQTVAKLTGIAFHQCLGMTALCPDKCGQSGDYANFEIVAYISYKKVGQYGDPKATTFSFQIVDNLKNLKVAKELAEKVRGLKAGDYVLLNWRHDYVTITEPGGGQTKSPDRPVTKVEKITKEEADKLIRGGAGAASQPASASRPAEDQGKTDPPGLPLKATLVLKKNSYAILAGQSGEAFAKELQTLAKPPKKPPLPPEVDMALELTNTGTKTIAVNLDGDAARLELKLEGPGAVTVPYMPMHTREFRMGVDTKIEPGKSITIPIARLLHGMRGDSSACYWTAPGLYTLTASYVTPVQGLDVPKDRQATITAAPVKAQVTVTKKGGTEGAATEPAALSVEALKNAEYRSEYAREGRARLVNGVHVEKESPNSETALRMSLGDTMATGDLNGDGVADAAVVLVSDPGGSGTFYELAAILNQDGKPNHVASALLGDRVRILAMTTKEGQVTVRMVTQGPNDPMGNPTLEVTYRYKLKDGKLVRVE